VSSFFWELFQTGVYKRSQGRVARQVTFGAVALCVLAGLWRLSQITIDQGPIVSFGVPGVLSLVGLWMSYRVVNVPIFADFLIAVEAEMNKVSWPSRGELYRSAIVVLVTIFAMAAVLFMYDVFWSKVFQLLEVIPR
jgi:preprotein translocase subunit SecE